MRNRQDWLMVGTRDICDGCFDLFVDSVKSSLLGRRLLHLLTVSARRLASALDRRLRAAEEGELGVADVRLLVGGGHCRAGRGRAGRGGEGGERRGLKTSRAKTHRHPDIACTWSCAGRCRQAWVPFVERAAVGWTSRPGGGQGPGRRATPKEAAEPECSPPHDGPSVQGMAASVLSRLAFGRRFFSAKLCPRSSAQTSPAPHIASAAPASLPQPLAWYLSATAGTQRALFACPSRSRSRPGRGWARARRGPGRGAG